MAQEAKVLKFEDITGRVFKQNMSPYRYKSPVYHVGTAYRWNQLVYVYIDGVEGMVDRKLFKNATNKAIIQYLSEFKSSRKYQVLVKDRKE